MTAPTLAQLVGINVKRLRLSAGLTLDKVATNGRGYGPGWTDSSIAAIERGDFRPTLQILVVLAQTIGDLSQSPVRLSDFLDGADTVQISDTLTVTTDYVRKLLNGEPVDLWADDVVLPEGERRQLEDASKRIDKAIKHIRTDPKFVEEGATYLTVRRAARRLGVDVTEIDRRSITKWGQSFLAERDSRVPTGASPQRVGAVTRAMLAELEAVAPDA
jgi:transcriptional regulator with XRE-family HTH domain